MYLWKLPGVVYGASTAFKPSKGNPLLCNLLPLVWRREDKIHSHSLVHLGALPRGRCIM